MQNKFSIAVSICMLLQTYANNMVLSNKVTSFHSSITNFSASVSVLGLMCNSYAIDADVANSCYSICIHTAAKNTDSPECHFGSNLQVPMSVLKSLAFHGACQSGTDM